jgi:hypothetical protein
VPPARAAARAGRPAGGHGASRAASHGARYREVAGRGLALALGVALLAAALLVDLSTFHRLEHGDSIVPVLVSLQRWTLFYWDQARYGMLVPLLALPVRDPLWNLLLQRGLLVLGGLSALVLLARHLGAGPGPGPGPAPGRGWAAAGLAAAAGLLALAPAAWQFEYLGDQPYGLALALAVGGLVVAEPPPAGGWPRPSRLAAGLLLVVLAHWVNAAAGVLLVGLAVARAIADRLDGVPVAAVRPRLVVDGALLGLGLAAGKGLVGLGTRLGGPPPEDLGSLLPLPEWPGAVATLLGHAWLEASGWGWWLLGMAALGLALRALPSLRAGRRAALLRALALLLPAAGYAVLMAELRWVALGGFQPRYLAPAALLVHLAAVTLLVEPLALLAGPSLGARLPRAGLAALLAAPAAAAALAWGAPSLQGVRRDLDAVAGRFTEDVLASGCQVIAGDYWSVWPAVWHVLWRTSERGEARPVHGLAHRAGPTAAAWQGLPRASLRLCQPHAAPSYWTRTTPYWMERYGAWPVHLVERRASLDVLALGPGAP